MNVEVTIDEPEIDIEVEEEEPEKTVCARLILTKKQKYLIKKYNQDGLFNRYFGYFIKYKYFKMDSAMLNLSVTADISDKEIEELKPNFDFKEVDAHLILTDKQKNDLHEAFNLLDYSGEGKIKAEDFRVAIKALSYEPTKEELQNMINGVDKGQSGKLSFENFETAIMRKIMALDSDGDIMKSFRLFDVDDTGLISFENVKHVCEILGDNLTDEEIEEMIDDADKDFDGYISVQEFMRMIKNSVNIVTP